MPIENSVAHSGAIAAALDALDGGPHEVYVGAMAQGIAAGLAADRQALQVQFASYL